MPKLECPHCRSKLESDEDLRTCTVCERPITNASGQQLRPLDIDFDARLERLDGQVLASLKTGTIVTLILSLASLLPAVGAVTGLAIFVFQLIWARWKTASPYARFFSSGRRWVTRWLSRMAVLTLASLHGTNIVPGLGILVSPVLFAGICAAVWGYFRYHLIREHRREPVLLIEKILVFAVAAVLLVLVIVFIVLAWLAGSVAKLLGLGV